MLEGLGAFRGFWKSNRQVFDYTLNQGTPVVQLMRCDGWIFSKAVAMFVLMSHGASELRVLAFPFLNWSLFCTNQVNERPCSEGVF